MAHVFNSAVWQLIKQSDWVSKYIVMLSLFVLSVVCVAVMIFKFRTYQAHKKNLARLIPRLKQAKTMHDLATISKEFSSTLSGSFVSSVVGDIKNLLEEKKQLLNETLSSHHATVSQQDLEALDLAINQHIDALVLEEETYLPMLGTAASVSPLIGLFGTIWGLIHCFVSISQERSADIATVAPGIAEALITTLGGLIVAIPALVAFNYYSNELRKIEASLAQAGELMLLLCKKTLLTKVVSHAQKTTLGQPSQGA